MDVAGSGLKSFSGRLATFSNYKGLLNILQLARLGYYHYADNQIRCIECGDLFISWHPEEDFFAKHKETLCSYKNILFSVHNKYVSNETVDKWLLKNYVIKLFKNGDYSLEELTNLLKDFLSIKGPDACLSMFKQYLFFKKHN